MSNQSHSQISRILSMYENLRKGRGINKKIESQRFQVDEKTIQRDIKHLRDYLETQKQNEFLEYNRISKEYLLHTSKTSFLKNDEIFAIVKILIESRAFPKWEMQSVTEKLTHLVEPNNQRFMKQMILNEKHLYVELAHKKSVTSLLWSLAQAIYSKRIIEIQYKKEFDQIGKERLLKPVGIVFSEYYFYLIAYQIEYDFDFPTIYRIDRVKSLNVLDRRFEMPYANRFQEGEFRKRVQFMYSGELMTIKFKFTGSSPQSVLDRLPTARIVKEVNNCTEFMAEVYGEGIKMWLLSQGRHIEVLEPQKLRTELHEEITKMKSTYES
ncbi:WYL domain-containing protein [Psychrobacillus sp. NEAU-3TGS]|uniref:helix-turn-helix transcriptional regulator n=1 Tax=Psychrobacillus sp. NEAU-3TGS TaxID=2995412 RepID=UPI002498A2D8|nr:WYL domain-containing protein [Psychrobacillus sp. NEAU-3TGS]MDI2587630.1 WYL domain-containing protein [Psychrobacillus sp. NEAU-3TGS]